MNYLTVDIETTGLNLISDLPIQFAYLGAKKAPSGTWTTESDAFYIKSLRPIPEAASRVNRITDETLLRSGIPLGRAAEDYNKLVWSYQPVTLIGYNIINFDLPIIQNWLFDWNPKRFKHPPVEVVIDVMHLAGRHFKTKKWLKLSLAAQKLGIEFDEESLHDALVDVKLTWEVFKLLKRI